MNKEPFRRLGIQNAFPSFEDVSKVIQLVIQRIGSHKPRVDLYQLPAQKWTCSACTECLRLFILSALNQ